METATYATEAPSSGPDLRAARERARLERSEIAEIMGVGRQRVVDLEGAVDVTPAAAARYRAALEEALLARIVDLAAAVSSAP